MIDGVKILFAEDHSVVRSSLGMLLESHIAQIVAEAEDGKGAVDKVIELHPDIILVDITLPDMDGIEATRRICAAWPEAKILALTMQSEDVYLTKKN